MAKPHICDDRCICPIHHTPLLYAASIDDHACQDVDCQHGHGMWKTLLFTSIADAPRTMLGVEDDAALSNQVRVQGSPLLSPGMGVLVDPACLPSWVTDDVERPDPLMSSEAMDLDANDAYWRPE